MDAAKHTPGPWQAVEWTCHAATTVKAGDTVVAECSGFGRLAKESLADARLIAAAPELLEALQSLIGDAEDAAAVNVHQGFFDIAAERKGRINAARASIAKATGGTQ